jgi:hypothetical protein
MQNLAMQEHDPIEISIYHKQPIVMLKLIPIGEADAKKAFISGELIYVSYHKNPVSFMECETIYISKGKPFKAAINSWKSRNQGTPHYFTMDRSIGGYY